MRIMKYIQPEIISHITNNYISEESDYYAIWENVRGDSFCFIIRVIELNKQFWTNDVYGIYPLIKI